MNNQQRLLSNEIVEKKDILATLKGHYQHKYPHTKQEEFWVRVDYKKWKELDLRNGE